MMSNEMLFVFVTVTGAAVLFASNRVRLDTVALGVTLAMMLSGILTPIQSLAGFGDPVVILVAGLLIVGEMLDRTGVAQSIGVWIIRTGGSNETRLIVLLMLAAAALSSLMSSTAVVAILIPVVFKVAGNTGINASRLLMPMSFAAMMSGMLTLIATPPNLVISSELESTQGYDALGFFGFMPSDWSCWRWESFTYCLSGDACSPIMPERLIRLSNDRSKRCGVNSSSTSVWIG